MIFREVKQEGLEWELWKNKPIYIPDDFQRWLDHESHVQFSLKQRTSRNAEFFVNDTPFHTIWYSQLAEIFLNIHNLNLCTGRVVQKDGKEVYTVQMGVDSFIRFVEGKTFKVLVDPSVAKLNVKRIPNSARSFDYVRSLINNGEYSKAASYLIQSTEYTLIEI